MNNLNINQNYSINQMRDMLKSSQSKNSNTGTSGIGQSFEEILALQREKNISLKFSKHASERLIDRNIDMSDEDIKRLETGAKRASEKGIKESLIMVDDVAFIVNLKNNTVVTCVSGDDDKVFSNIDGAVIA